MFPDDLRPKDLMTVNRIRRTDKYDAMDDASYEALMKSRRIYPYLMEWDVSENKQTEDIECSAAGYTQFEATHTAIPGD